MATLGPGLDKYEGSERYGVTSNNWGSYGSSFVVEAALPSSFLEACSQLPAGAETLTCACGADDGNNGGVWGSGPYTADSSICAAARHAGNLGAESGTVNVMRIQGLESYIGSEWNDVRSADWGPYDSSIVFNGN